MTPHNCEFSDVVYFETKANISTSKWRSLSPISGAGRIPGTDSGIRVYEFLCVEELVGRGGGRREAAAGEGASQGAKGVLHGLPLWEAPP